MFKLFLGSLVSTRAKEDVTCLGEFQLCDQTHDCALDHSLCGICSGGEYVCPLTKRCATSDLRGCAVEGTHWDPHLSIEQRLEYLSRSSNLSEKIAQLVTDAPAIPRLGVPAYGWVNDDLHAVRNSSFLSSSTVFPNGCGLGATWSAGTIKEVAAALAHEARGVHNANVHAGHRLGYNGWGITAYSPNVNLVRDPRWGRAQEVYGEDPLHMGKLATAYVQGLQSNGSHILVAATCKHFAVYDLERASLRGEWRMAFNAIVGAKDLWESYLVALEACVVQGKAEQVMCSYNAVNGVPSCGNHNLLNGILRNRWGFNGSVVSDFDAWANFVPWFHYQNLTIAAATGLNAGLDQEGGGTQVIKHMQDAVQNHLTSVQHIDQAFRRLFRTRVRLGMFDPPADVRHNFLIYDETVLQRHRQLALRSVRESICLYKNDGATLPLQPGIPSKIAVVGPHAVLAQELLGSYIEPGAVPTNIDRLLTGLGRWMGEDGEFLRKADACAEDETSSASVCDKVSGSRITFSAGCRDVACRSQDLFASAGDVAEQATVVIVVLGLRYDAIGDCMNCSVNDPPDWCTTSGCEFEGFDRTSIDLPPNQYKLVQMLRRRTKGNLIGVFIHGGVFALHNLWKDLDAIVDMWYPGFAAGRALADVLFGAYSPAGRTAVTWYGNDWDLPRNRSNVSWYAEKGLSYRFFTGTPQIPFGHGLSYTFFTYAVHAHEKRISVCAQLVLVVSVCNIGSMDSDDVVQLYLMSASAADAERHPLIQLLAFDRIHILKGQCSDVTLEVLPDRFAHVVPGRTVYEAEKIVNKGKMPLFVGGGQPYANASGVYLDLDVVSTYDIASCSKTTDGAVLI